MAKQQTSIEFGQRLTPRKHLLWSAVTSGPSILWLTVFLLLPLIAVIAISFFTRDAYGDVKLPLTFGNFRRVAGFGFFGFDPLYPQIMLRSLVLGAVTTVVCLGGGIPLALFIAAMPGRWKTAALTLAVIPVWTNLLIRTYAWQILLAPDSLLARGAAALHLIPASSPLYPSAFAVYIGMACDFLPFLVLPLYASVEKVDWSIAEAAMDLGADGWRVFWHAVLPQIRPGLIAGIILVFIPATGQFVIPDLLGGGKQAMIGNAIQQQFGSSRDWPFGSAIAFCSMAAVLFAFWIYARAQGGKGAEESTWL
jgi:spermidine/putrescine transport system permease protein